MTLPGSAGASSPASSARRRSRRRLSRSLRRPLPTLGPWRPSSPARATGPPRLSPSFDKLRTRVAARVRLVSNPVVSLSNHGDAKRTMGVCSLSCGGCAAVGSVLCRSAGSVARIVGGAGGMPWLWAVFTVVACAGQVMRNAMEKELTATLGTVGATHVRFLFCLPFALLFLAGVLAATGLPIPRLNTATIAWTVVGAITQIGATALLLAVMQQRSFVVTTAYIKTEP